MIHPKKTMLDHQEVKSLKVKDKDDLKYMHDQNAAILMHEGKYARAIIWGFLLFLLTLTVWISFAKIDKMTRGIGKVVPSLELQYIQSFDGGIIEEIFVHEGTSLHKDDPIVLIDDKDFRSRFQGSEADINALNARIVRLTAESKNIAFCSDDCNDSKLKKKLISEKKLYDSKHNTLEKKISIIEEKVTQKQLEFSTMRIEIDTLKRSLSLAQETLDISKRMLEHKVVSRMQYNEQLKQFNTIDGDLRRKQELLPKVESEIKGLMQEVTHATLTFQSEAHAELEKTTAEFEKLTEAKKIDKGRVNRALIVSPINGIIKTMHYNTIGGVVKAGGVIAEIVPTEEHLIIDTKIDPSKIAFIYAGQEAVVRFSAYDFATYGSLKGEVISISADTTIDEVDKKHYYNVKIKTNKNYLQKNKKELPIKIGMVATIDIMNGKQSILDYILNPIIKAQQNMLSDN